MVDLNIRVDTSKYTRDKSKYVWVTRGRNGQKKTLTYMREAEVDPGEEKRKEEKTRIRKKKHDKVVSYRPIYIKNEVKSKTNYMKTQTPVYLDSR